MAIIILEPKHQNCIRRYKKITTRVTGCSLI